MALKWILAAEAFDGQFARLPELETLMKKKGDAGYFFEVQVSQSVGHDSIEWYQTRFEDVVTQAIAKVLGVKSFYKAEDYLAWRARNPELLDSYEFWRDQLGNAGPELGAKFKQLHAHNALLALRVVIDHSMESQVGPAQVNQVIRRSIPPPELLKLLTAIGKHGDRDEDWVALWPEIKGRKPDAALGRHMREWLWKFRRYVLAHAKELFDPAQAPGILSLWAASPHDSSYALAAAALNPGRRREILVKAQTGTSPDQELLEPLIRDFAREEKALISHLLSQVLGSAYGRGELQSYIAPLGHAGAPGLQILKTWTLDPRFERFLKVDPRRLAPGGRKSPPSEMDRFTGIERWEVAEFLNELIEVNQQAGGKIEKITDPLDPWWRRHKFGKGGPQTRAQEEELRKTEQGRNRFLEEANASRWRSLKSWLASL